MAPRAPRLLSLCLSVCLAPALHAQAPADRSALLAYADSLAAATTVDQVRDLEAARVGCVGLDFNSGVESAPGRKDAHKLAAAFGALRQL